ncbi:hypothetical protein [Rugamonas apoptosis]|uniref:Uncharacterized protein n=1 Tax=Rugamonas apoptosis TaxID=2758570 RepID=A0A7W2FF87_9BURK|nr:hypothetical protein [Rugamonas apoptosis]MBA5690643.1 hypothetical protein [Rugamonas apoptosis]
MKNIPIPEHLIEQAIESMSNEFDSHDVIKEFAQKNQRIYAEALVAVEGDRLFHKLHSDIGRQIAAICEHLGYTRIQSRSDDIFGQKSRCLGWFKS